MKKIVLLATLAACVVCLSVMPSDAGVVFRSKARGSCSGMSRSVTRASCGGVSRARARTMMRRAARSCGGSVDVEF